MHSETFEKYAPDVVKSDLIAKMEFKMPQVKTTSAAKAYKEVLKYVGASLVRDEADKRYIRNVTSSSFQYKGTKGSDNGMIDSQNDVGAWQYYNSLPAPADSNADGIPDGWLEKFYPTKKSNDLNKQGYTYLEVYLNGLVKHIK